MRWMTWCLGVMVLVAVQQSSVACGRGWGWQWTVMLIFWVFAGAGALLTGVIRLVSGKVRAGAFHGVQPPGPGAPAPRKGE